MCVRVLVGLVLQLSCVCVCVCVCTQAVRVLDHHRNSCSDYSGLALDTTARLDHPYTPSYLQQWTPFTHTHVSFLLAASKHRPNEWKCTCVCPLFHSGNFFLLFKVHMRMIHIYTPITLCVLQWQGELCCYNSYVFSFLVLNMCKYNMCCTVLG